MALGAIKIIETLDALKELITIGRKTGEKEIEFFPDVARANHVPTGRIWLPLEGFFTEALPAEGPAVIFGD